LVATTTYAKNKYNIIIVNIQFILFEASCHFAKQKHFNQTSGNVPFKVG